MADSMTEWAPRLAVPVRSSSLRQRGLSGQVTISRDAAGTFLLVRFTSGVIPTAAAQRGVRLASTERYYLSRAPSHEYILRFSGIGDRTIREGIRRLGAP